MDYTESDLRRDIFTNYNKFNIPVKNGSNTVDLLYGISIESLVFFNQKAETIKINTLTTLMEDEYLKWDNDDGHNHHDHNPDFIVIPNYLIWHPDKELYNLDQNPKFLIKQVFQNYAVMG